jgi:hypothetical protein
VRRGKRRLNRSACLSFSRVHESFSGPVAFPERACPLAVLERGTSHGGHAAAPPRPSMNSRRRIHRLLSCIVDSLSRSGLPDWPVSRSFCSARSRSSSSARHYDQIRFRFRTAWGPTRTSSYPQKLPAFRCTAGSGKPLVVVLCSRPVQWHRLPVLTPSPAGQGPWLT